MNKTDILKLIKKVNDRYIADHPESGDCSWEKSCYFLGLAAAYEVTKEKRYLDYIFKWAEDNDWNFYFGEPQTVPTYQNADYQFCGEIYTWLLDKLGLDKHGKKYIMEAETTLCDKDVDYWWWVDTIYMALPLLHIMGVRHGDKRYFEKAHRLFTNTRTERRCYDEEEHLWYRDERFFPDKLLSKNGKKIFWSRGNGWVFAGIARTLEAITEECEYYGEYKKIFCDMAERIAPLIRPDGGFTTGLLDPDEFPLSETSGTALFTLGFLIGVRIGVLDRTYLKTALRGFEWITNNAVLENGRVGFVQGISWSPEKRWENYDYETKKQNSMDYAVGVYLMILKEIIALDENTEE